MARTGVNTDRTLLRDYTVVVCLAAAVFLCGCDKIDDLRDSLTKGQARHGRQDNTATERFAESQSSDRQSGPRASPGKKPDVTYDVIARAISFVPGDPAAQKDEIRAGEPGILQASFDNTYASSAEVEVKIAVDGIVVADDAVNMPAQSEWSYSAPYTFIKPGNHTLGMSVYLKRGMPVREADINNNETSGAIKVLPEKNDINSPAAGAPPGQGPGDASLAIEPNDIAARSIGFMPDGLGRYSGQVSAGTEGMVRVTFANGFKYDANLRVRITDGATVISDVVLAVPKKFQGSYFAKHSFDTPGPHTLKLGVYQSNTAFPESDPLNNETMTIINVTPADGKDANAKYAANDIIARTVTFEPEIPGPGPGEVVLGSLGRIKLFYTSTFPGAVNLIVSWTIDGNPAAEVPLNNVSTGDHYTAISYTFDTPGEHKIGAGIKFATGSTVKEADGGNDAVEGTVKVVEPPAPQIPPQPAHEQTGTADNASPVEPGPPAGPVNQVPVDPNPAPMPIAAAPVAMPARLPTGPSCDLTASGIVFLAAPDYAPVDRTATGAKGHIAYTIKNASGALTGVTAKIKLETGGVTKFSLTKKVDMPESGVFDGTVASDIILSQPGQYILSLAVDHPDNSDASRTNRYNEAKSALEVR